MTKPIRVGDKVKMRGGTGVEYTVAEVELPMVRLEYERADGRMVNGGWVDFSLLQEVN